MMDDLVGTLLVLLVAAIAVGAYWWTTSCGYVAPVVLPPPPPGTPLLALGQYAVDPSFAWLLLPNPGT